MRYGSRRERRASSLTFLNPPVFFALFSGIPGNLIIAPSHIRFSSTRGFRTLSVVSGKLAKKLASRSSTELSDSESVKSVKVSETGYAVDIGVEQVVGVKKESRFRFEGLVITTKDGEVSAACLRFDFPGSQRGRS